MKKFIAFSGGVESSAMCVLFAGQATPIFTDTGFEHKPLMARLGEMEAALRIIHSQPSLSVIRIRAENVDGTGVATLPDYIKLRKFYPSSMARFCTRLFKIKPMDDFLRKQGPCEVMIGLNYDEADDRTGNYGECPNVTYSYPLIDAKLTRADCEQLLSAHGLLPNFPAFMHRGGCVGCFYKSKNEYEAMALMAPDEALMVAEIEEAIQDKRGNYYHIHPQIPNMREFIKQAQHGQLFKTDEMYSEKPDTGTPCGVFCHR